MFSKLDWSKGKGYGEKVGSMYRYLQPIYIKKACFKCHGEPAGGELDMVGKKKEGYKLGRTAGCN